MAAELSGILDHVETIAELDLDGVEPTTHVVVLENVLRADRAAARASSASRRWPTPRTPATTPSAFPRRRRERTARPERRRRPRRDRGGKPLRRGVVRRLRRGRRRARRLPLARRGPAIVGLRGRRRARSAACRSPSRTSSASRACRRRRAPGSSRATCPPYTATAVERLLGGRRSRSSARPTWTSSRWGPRTRTRPTATSATPGIPTRVPGGSSGGSAAAVAGRPGAVRDRHRHRRLDPPAGRALRRRRPEADLRGDLALGDDRLRLLARPVRPLHPRRHATPPCCCGR